MITKDQNGNGTDHTKEQSPDAQVSNYFKKHKSCREDQENQLDSLMYNSSMRQPQIIRQESWTAKRSENNSMTNIQSVSSALSEKASDPFSELDKKYPGFNKGKGYLKLES